VAQSVHRIVASSPCDRRHGFEEERELPATFGHNLGFLAA
jgi:hypothetical protein